MRVQVPSTAYFLNLGATMKFRVAERVPIPHIPIPEEVALAALLRVKPTKDMPRPGTNPTKSAMDRLNEEFGPLELGKRAKRKQAKKVK